MKESLLNTIDILKVNGKEKRSSTKINIEKIPAFCAIGIDPEERKKGQTLLIDVYLDIDSKRLVEDRIESTISYVDVFILFKKFVNQNRIHL